MFQSDFVFVTVESKLVHISSQIKNLLDHLDSGVNKVQQLLFVYYISGCVLFARNIELNETVLAFKEDRYINK